MKRIFIIAVLTQVLFSTGFDSEDGAPIRQGVHIEWYRTLAPGNQGEAIFVWSDTRFGMRNIFAHKINQDGDLLWGDLGATVTNLPGRQEDPVSITDGTGGAYVAWVDYRFDAQGDIFIQHINSNGEILMDPNGLALSQVSGKQISINMCTDSLGGVFVTWQDKRSGIDDDIYGTHVSSEHEILAPGSGLPIIVAGGNQNAKTIEYSGNNTAFIAWADFREGANADIYGQRFGLDMTMQFEDTGLQIAGSEEQELKPRATYVNNGVSFICWKQGDENSKIFYQFVDTNGPVFESAKSISLNDAIQTSPRVKRSSIGEIFVNWKDLRNDPISGDQYFQKIDVNGDKLWDDGIRLDLSENADFSARFTPDANGGINVVWERGTFPEIDIMYQNIISNGSYINENPVTISEESGYQYAPIVSGDTQLGGLYIIYGDQGNGSIDLKVQKIDSDFNTAWADNGLTVMTGLDGDINYTQTFKLDNEDLLLFWEDNRASKKIYGNRIINSEITDSNGKQLSFGDNSSSETDFSTPYYIKSETGIYSATFDGLSSPKFLRINRIDDSLNNLWADSGVALTPVFDMRSVLLTEVEGGVGCFWSESRGFNYDIYYQKLDVNGNLLLDNQGIELVDSPGDDYLSAIIPTPDNKFIIFWLEDAWPAAALKFTKIDTDGNLEIGWNPNGNDLSSSQFDSRNLEVKIINDEVGMLAVWTQDGNFSDIYAQVIDWDGNIHFNENIIISDADNDQGNISFELNQSGTHSFIAWEDYRNGSDFEIFADILNIQNGTLENNVIQFSNDTTNQYNPTVKFLQDNEFLIIWEDERGYYNQDPLLINGVDLYGSGYNIGQGMTTNQNGIPICIAYHKQQNVNITHHQNEEYFLDWIDYRSSGKEDLANYYGRMLMKAELLSNKIDCIGCEVPKAFTLNSAYPNPFNGSISFDYYIPQKEPVEFSVYDVTGSQVVNKLILPGFGGNSRITWDGKQANGHLVSSGLSFYVFKSNNSITKGKVTYLK